MEESSEVQKKMLVFDMDDTLLRGRFIDKCAEKYNFKQALSLLRQIDHDPASLTARIALFLTGRRKSELQEIAERIPLVDDIAEVTVEMRRRGYFVGIISDSYQLVTDYIAHKLNLDFSLGNELQCDGEYLNGQVSIPFYFKHSEKSTCRHPVCKTNALRYICNLYGIGMENCVVVGDSENDICIVKHAGLGVAFCTTNEPLISAAGKHIEQKAFGELLKFAY
jgi:phosphoserine phosphatase SerB